MVFLERAHPDLTFLQRANAINTGLGRAKGRYDRNFLRNGGVANRDLVFLSQSWSRCPAEKWVPALLEGVWTRVSATLHESYVA